MLHWAAETNESNKMHTVAFLMLCCDCYCDNRINARNEKRCRLTRALSEYGRTSKQHLLKAFEVDVCHHIIFLKHLESRAMMQLGPVRGKTLAVHRFLIFKVT